MGLLLGGDDTGEMFFFPFFFFFLVFSPRFFLFAVVRSVVGPFLLHFFFCSGRVCGVLTFVCPRSTTCFRSCSHYTHAPRMGLAAISGVRDHHSPLLSHHCTLLTPWISLHTVNIQASYNRDSWALAALSDVYLSQILGIIHFRPGNTSAGD